MSNTENQSQFGEPNNAPHRIVILIAGVVLLASLGSVYAWSFFTKPLQAAYLWTNFQTGLVFSLAVAGLGFSALYTGPYVSKLGGRHLMKRSAKFYVTGHLVAALGLYLGSGVIGSIETAWVSWLSYTVLALGYGVIGGIGLGTGYVTAVSTVSGWFPDKKGLATGLIVMGFGLGALFMSKVFAPFAMQLASGNVALAFLIIGVFFAVIMSIACYFMYSPYASVAAKAKVTRADTYDHPNHVRFRLWLVCFLYSIAGLGMISLLSPLMQNILRASDPTLSATSLAAAGATLIALASLGNAFGRLFWAGISDYLGRVNVFIVFLSSASVVYLILPTVTSPLLFTILICFVVASYGGGFGTIPSLISDMFGAKRMSALHGLVLTGWATAGLTAPPLFGLMYDRIPENAATVAYYVCAGALILATVMVFTLKRRHTICSEPVEVEHALEAAEAL